MSIANQVWDGKYHEKQSSLLGIHREFFKKLEQAKNGKTIFENKLRGCKTNLERIEAVKEFYEWIPFNSKEIQKYQKSKTIATEFRQRGNELYKSQKFEEAIKAYNLALGFAPPEDEELALVFGNRSAVFVQTKKPLLALQDIKRCFSHGYPEHLKPKLLERKMKCLKTLRLERIKTEEDSDSLEDMLTRLMIENVEQFDEETEKRNQFCKFDLFKLKNPNVLIPCAEDFVNIENNAERGRHVIVTKSVPPGTLIIVDQPFSKILLKEVTWDWEHCNNCHQRRCDSGVACPFCAFGFYCDEECKEDAWKKFHQYECQCTPYLHLAKSTRIHLLAFRIICTLGSENLRNHYASRTNLSNQSQDKILGSDDNGVYNYGSYSTIFNLVSHPGQHDISEMISYCINSLSLVSILGSRTSFFDLDYTEEFRRTDFQNFVASLILLHIQNLPCNAHSLNELILPNDGKLTMADNIRNATCQEYGAGAFALLSLINHSCDPNVFRVNLHTGHTAVVTIRGLKTGEEVLDNYGSHFALDPVEQRNKHLYQNYSFECNCIACSRKWPLLPELVELRHVFVCSRCTGFKLSERLESEYIENCAYISGRHSCGICKKDVEMTALENLNNTIDKFFCAYDKVLQNKPLEVLQELINCMTYFENNLLPPFSRTNDAQETFKQALNLIVHFSNVRM